MGHNAKYLRSEILTAYASICEEEDLRELAHGYSVPTGNPYQVRDTSTGINVLPRLILSLAPTTRIVH